MSKRIVRIWGSDSDMESLAALVRKSETPGVAFARSQLRDPGSRTEKDFARSKIIGDLSALKRPEPISILTMPGVTWRFEKSLLRLREPDREEGKVVRTNITSIEREPAIFTAALKDIPGADLGLTHLPDDFPKSTYTMRTPFIRRFHLTTFEEFAEANTRLFTDAWLDFTGPLTDRLLETIPYFWNSVERSISITMLNARWNRRISTKVQRAGGVANLLMEQLSGPKTLSDTHRYNDTVPMIQMTFTKDPVIVPA